MSMCVTRGPHEWDEVFDAEPDVDYVYLYQHCMAAEIVGAQTSERLDETFYEYGATCDATRTITYFLTRAVRRSDGLEVTYDADPSLLEELATIAAQELTEHVEPWTEDFDDVGFSVSLGGEEYFMEYKLDGVRVHE